MRVRAALFEAPGAPLVVRTVDLDGPGPGDALVRVDAVGICGSDLHVVKGEWVRPRPMVLGHEGAGVVEAVGADVDGLAVGDRVILSWAPACGECGPCLAGRTTACLPLRAGIGAGTLPDGTTRLSADGETIYRMTAVGALAERVVMPAERRAQAHARAARGRGRAARLRRTDRDRRRARGGAGRRGGRDRRRRRRPVLRTGRAPAGRLARSSPSTRCPRAARSRAPSAQRTTAIPGT